MADYDYDSLPVKHVRHKIDISRDALRELADEKRVAIHWGDTRSRDPEDYSKGSDDIETVNEIDDTGAIMVADYSSDYKEDGVLQRKGIHKSKLFVGVIQPGSFDYREYAKDSGGTGIFKTLKFDEETYQEISITDREDLFSDVPVRGTINNCNKTEDRLRELVDPSKTVSKLSPDYFGEEEFEHICMQYLSLVEFPGEFFALGPAGGADDNLQLIDINGGVGDTPVVAQVTTATSRGEVEGKLQDLAEEFTGDTVAYFFGPQKYADELRGAYEAVEYVGDQEVFERLEDDPKTEPMMDRCFVEPN